jgi:fructokinase
MPDIVTIGEALIDFFSVQKGVRIEEGAGFTAAPGGAPANVAAAVAKLGGKAGFIGKVGADSFGKMIRMALEDAGVDLGAFKMDATVNTTLAFVATRENGEPDFTFYRNHCGADIALRSDEIDEGYICEAKIFHFGSLNFTNEPLRSATIRAIEIALGAKRTISFDPNLRPSLWDSLRTARAEMEKGLEYADIVKMTEEELEFLTGTAHLLKGTDLILKYGPRMVVVTRGGKSTFFNNGDINCEVPAFTVDFVEATGAGDAFVGGLLISMLERMRREVSLYKPHEDEVREILFFANACGALTVTKKGVIPALPTLDEVESFIKKR